MSNIKCVRCGQERARLPFKPFNTPFGERIYEEICQPCWGEWLRHQTMLINHYGLNLQDPDARRFLLENTETFLYGTGETEQVDTSKQGTIQW
jgi:Fe-S cluster biosynthesis and repair protein YggX